MVEEPHLPHQQSAPIRLLGAYLLRERSGGFRMGNHETARKETLGPQSIRGHQLLEKKRMDMIWVWKPY